VRHPGELLQVIIGKRGYFSNPTSFLYGLTERYIRLLVQVVPPSEQPL